MRKSRASTQNYRPGGSRKPVALGSFRDQMADYARAERLRELRDGIHWSREKVAGEIGVSTKTLYAWENGGSIRWDNAKKLGAFYNVDPESLVSRELGDMPANGAPDTRTTDARLARIEAKLDLVLAYVGLEEEDPELNDAVDAVVRALEDHATGATTGAATA